MKTFLNHRTGVFVLLVVAFFIFNWRYTAQEVFHESSAQSTINQGEEQAINYDFDQLSKPRFSVAGFPFRYWEKSEFDGKPFATMRWGVLALNGLLWLGGLIAFVGYEAAMARALAKRKQDNPKEPDKRRLGVADLMVLTGIIALGVGYWRWSVYSASAEATLAQSIRDAKGFTTSTLLLPEVAAVRIPDTWHSDLKRVSEVALTNPTTEVLEKVVQLPYLKHLSIDSGEADLSLLARLKDRPLFISLRIANRRVDEQLVQTVASLTQLQNLVITRSSLTDAQLAQVTALPRLQYFNAVDSVVTLRGCAGLKCAQTARILELPRPEEKNGDALELTNWPELRKLVCNSVMRKPNNETVQLVVKDMPKLANIQLDAMQLYDLELDNVPKLESVGALMSYRQSRLKDGGSTSTVPCIAHLKLGELPGCKNFNLHAQALRDLEFTRPLTCFFKFSSQTMTANGSSINSMPVARSRVQRWLDAFRDGVGPSWVTFEHVDMRKTNFDNLAKSSSLRHLAFVGCQLDAAQLGALRGMQGLEELHLGQLPLTGPQIEAIVSSLPKLSILECDGSAVKRLKLVNSTTIRSIFAAQQTGPTPLEALHLAHMPNFAEKIDLPANLFYLHLEDVPAITQLTTSGPWPAKAVFKGLRNLKVFAASGPNLTDEVIDELIKCEKLEQLSLTDHSLSPASLARLGSLTRLQRLDLSRSKLDDAGLAALGGLSQLSSLKVEETQITEQSLPTLAKLTALEKLSISGTNVATDSLSQLASLSQLRELHCASLPFSEGAMRGLANLKSLRYLDLTNTELNTTTVMQLGQISNLERLTLNDCRLDGQVLMAVAEQARNVQFELSNSSVDRNTFELLRHSRRIYMPLPDQSSAVPIDNSSVPSILFGP